MNEEIFDVKLEKNYLNEMDYKYVYENFITNIFEDDITGLNFILVRKP